MHSNERARWVAAIMLAGACILSAPLAAQQNSPGAGPLGALSGNSDAPIQVNSDTLEVRDKEKKAIFRGNVVVVQGDMTLHTVELWVDYDAPAGAGAATAPAGDTEQQRIRRLEAKGKVLVLTSEQKTSGDWAIYEVKNEQVTVGGKVVVTQGVNVISGTRLVLDMRTGRTHFESSDKKGERVQAVFAPKSDKSAKPVQ